MSHAGIQVGATEIRGEVLRAEVVVAVDSPWFSDHFPGAPILPAIAHFDLLCRVHRAGGGSGRILALDRVRLSSPVGPGDRLEMTIEPWAGEASAFTVRGAAGRPVSDGRVRWARESGPV